MRSRFRYKRWVSVTLLALFASAILSACGNSPAFTDPRGPVAKKESDLWWVIFIIAVIIFIGVTSVLLYSVIRFRARPDSPAPRQNPGHTPIEIVWTLIPTVILFIILGVTITTMFSLGDITGNRTLNVTAVAHQWWFEFQYPNEKFVTADEMHIPVGAIVEVSMVSDNVIHSFWVPQLAGKIDIIPGHDNKLKFKADVPGVFRGECAEYCGIQHAHMDFEVVAQSPADYDAWVSGQQAGPAQPAAGSPEEAGMAVFQHAGCTGCHVIGQGPPGAKLIGPNLTHFGSRQLIAGGVLENTNDNLARWILHAQDIKPGSDMPSFDGSYSAQNLGGYQALSQEQITQLVAYLESLK
jgi:cytochrome c oxidase subunit II